MKSAYKLENTISKTIICLLVYLLILSISGILKSNIIIDIIPSELINSAKISSYVSVIISSTISILIIGFMICIVYFLNIIFALGINEKSLIVSFGNAIFVFILFEVIKFIFAYVMLEKDIRNITFSENLIESIKETSWFYYDNILKLLMIIMSSLVYIITLKIKEIDTKHSTMLFLLFTLLIGFYISTLEYS
nr:hypothetical protein [uncultured Flavobacterium sp.]